MKTLMEDLRVNRRNPLIVSTLVTFRYGHWVYYHVKLPVARQLLWLIYQFLDTVVVRIAGHGELPARCHIGPGLHIPHGVNGVIVHWDTIIGRNTTIYHQVTIGAKDPSTPEEYGPPHIGDRVFVGAGAKIIGRIIIGSDALIGANAVVISDIPCNATAVGIPARVIRSHSKVPQGYV